MTKFWSVSQSKLFRLLNTNSNGLTQKEAVLRQQQHGINVLPEGPKRSLINRVLSQFADFLIVLLIISALIALFLGETVDAVAILVIVVINAAIGFVQEYKAEQALSDLLSKEQQESKCYRDQKLKVIKIKDLVPGDLLLVEAGDKIPADCRILKSYSLKVDEALLTGESLPVEKNEVDLPEKTVLAEQHNMLFRGTAVMQGKATAIVVRTGSTTEVGRIAQALAISDKEPTPLQKELHHIAKRLTVLILIIAIVVFGMLIYRQSSFIEALLTAIALSVAAIPEGLPAIVAIVLSVGVLHLARKKTIVRTLKAVETLGAIKYLLTDKTGTLTWNKINVVRLLDKNKQEYQVRGEGYQLEGEFLDSQNKPLSKNRREDLQPLMEVAAVCNSAELEFTDHEVKVVGDTTEGALLVAAERFKTHYQELRQRYEIVSEEPFSSETKRMLMLVRHKSTKKYFIFAKGAPEVILNLCQNKDQDLIEKTNIWATNGWRNLSLAYCSLKPTEINRWQRKIPPLQFLGLIAQEDAVRKEAIEAVKKAKIAGITTIMITGDHRLAAYSIGKQVGIASNRSQVIDGAELDQIEDDFLLNKLLAQKQPIRIFSRVSPEQKLRIVKLIKERTEAIIGVTGDGVNDAPSIKAADVGVAMGLSGSDVAKGVADLVIADDNYATLVTGIFQGRVIFDNLIKFVRYLLSCNIGEVVVVFLGTMFGQLHILLPIQILFINLATDSLPALALGFEKGTRSVLLRQPRNPHERILNINRSTGILIEGVFIGLVVLFTFYYFLPLGFEYSRTMAFLVLVIAQLLQALNSRSEKETNFEIGFFSNPLLLLALLVSFLITYLATQSSWLQPVFRTEPITDISHWLTIMAISSTVLLMSGLRKKIGLW